MTDTAPQPGASPHRKTVLITGVGRLAGIGAGIARRLAADGWDLVLTYWQEYDARMPWGVQPEDVERLTAELEATGAAVRAIPADFEDPRAVAVLMAAAADAGPLHALVLSHAESVDSGILDTDLASFDRHFAVNTRASWQLIAAFAGQAAPTAARSLRSPATTPRSTCRTGLRRARWTGS